MTACSEFLKSEFPQIDDDLQQYVEDVLKNGAEDFEDSDEIFDAVGEVLHEISSDKSEDDIKIICEELLRILKPGQAEEDGKLNGPSKVLNAPVQMGAMMVHEDIEEINSIWVNSRDAGLKVDTKKLQKAEAKLQAKQCKRAKDAVKLPTIPKLDSASVSQVTNKKEDKMEAKGTNKVQDIRVENFDITYGDRVLLIGAELSLVFGRRYGLVGRNGLGKTTLLRTISSGQLKIPSHISILHVEQEVIGDDTLALDSVLECDVVRTQLLQKERELNAMANSGGLDNTAISSQLAQIYAQLQSIEADKAPARAAIILNGLGFNQQMQGRATKTFSGGWRMRLALARALFSRPDLLLLDEPTNMLDMKAVLWLKHYLQSWPTTLLVVSHDRNFLDSVPTDILYLHSQRIEAYRGNYDQFLKTKTEKHKNQQREYEAQQQHRAHVQEFIDKFRFNANRASSVQSKIKMLEKLPDLKPIEKETEVIIRFPDTEPLLPPILQLSEVSFKYTDDKMIFSNVDLNATLDSRICIVGDNGAGKTTLLKIIMGMLSPTAGMRYTHQNLKFGYFSQHHVDQLDMSVNSVQLLQAHMSGKTVEEYRRQLGSFGVSGNLALQVVASLSGGQKSRVAFARMCMSNPNFLVLDEPTNHLDIETIEALGHAINKYNGGVILVSHDERLIRMVCKELWVCEDGSVKCMEGGFEEYRKIVERELEIQRK